MVRVNCGEKPFTITADDKSAFETIVSPEVTLKMLNVSPGLTTIR